MLTEGNRDRRIVGPGTIVGEADQQKDHLLPDHQVGKSGTIPKS